MRRVSTGVFGAVSASKLYPYVSHKCAYVTGESSERKGVTGALLHPFVLSDHVAAPTSNGLVQFGCVPFMTILIHVAKRLDRVVKLLEECDALFALAPRSLYFGVSLGV
jgi:hypothetical protein